jgi:hypothetical protein
LIRVAVLLTVRLRYEQLPGWLRLELPEEPLAQHAGDAHCS